MMKPLSRVKLRPFLRLPFKGRPGGVADVVKAERHDDTDEIELIRRIDRVAAAVAPIPVAGFDCRLLVRRRGQAAAPGFLDGPAKAIPAHGRRL